MTTKWIEHQGKRILYIDYRGHKTDTEMFQTMDEEVKIEAASPVKVLGLANFVGVNVTANYMARVNKTGVEVRNQKVQKMALLGVTGLKLILLQSYFRFTGATNMKTFDTEAAALAWLVE